MITEEILLQHRVASFLYREADILDRWDLEAWEGLFSDDAQYLVPPTDVDGDQANPNTSLFYIFDDRNRLHERVVRLSKRGAHSEWPRSKTRHLVTNVIAQRNEAGITAKASFVVYRSKDGITDAFIGHYVYELDQIGDDLRIRKKTCVLDLEALRPHGRISILL